MENKNKILLVVPTYPKSKSKNFDKCLPVPLNQLYDHYDGQKYQTSGSYYIHPNWSDESIKNYRRLVRWQNIFVRLNLQNFDPAKMKYNVPYQVLADFGLV